MRRSIPLVVTSLGALLFITVSACSASEESGSTDTSITTSGTGGDDGAEGTGSASGDDEAATDGASGDDEATGVATGPLADLCTPCDVDVDCGVGGACVKDARGNGMCSRTCGYFGESACPEDYYCKQLGTASNDFFCWPLNGVCEVDGDDCSPCRPGGNDCGEGLSCFEPLGDIAFCVRACEGAGTCPHPGMECGHHASLEGSICLPKVNGVPVAKCGARPLEFCEPCTTEGQCATGVCVDSENIGQVCSMPCEATIDCPSGTGCVHNACVPPLAHGCQGFLSCLGVECLADEICHRGFCLPAP